MKRRWYWPAVALATLISIALIAGTFLVLPDSTNAALALCFASIPIATWASMFFTSYAVADGSLPRNQFAGMRTRKLMASDQAWKIGHTAALDVTRRSAYWLLPATAIFLAMILVSPLVALLGQSALSVASFVLIWFALSAANHAVDQMAGSNSVAGLPVS